MQYPGSPTLRRRALALLLTAAAAAPTPLAAARQAGEDALAAAGASPPAAAEPADVVELDNGDRLSGTVVRLAGGVLTLDTDWGGELEIDWTRVAALRSTGPLRLVLADGRSLTGRLVAAAVDPGDGEAGLAISPERGEEEPVELAAITAINPEERPAVVWSGHASAGLVATSGNTDTENAYLEAEVTADSEKNRYSLGASFKESEDDGVTKSSRTSAYLAYERRIDDRWYADGSATFTEDEFQDLDLRSTLAASVGYEIFATEVTDLSTEVGLAYVDERFLTAPDDAYAAGRWAVDFRRRISAERGIELFHGHELLISFEDSDDKLLSTKSGVRFQLFQKLVAAVQYKVDWDDSPPPGTVSTDRTLLLNLGLEW